MIALLSILGLLALASVLIALERSPWPLQRSEPIHDVAYWQAVQRDSAAYLETHTHISPQIRRNVKALNVAACQKVGGLVR